ncbi:MAG TPA: hypothetical protein VLE95_01895 [Chlamydiales bacterium]|nr:hypothetical protein [Chlamydiales bacterium]
MSNVHLNTGRNLLLDADHLVQDTVLDFLEPADYEEVRKVDGFRSIIDQKNEKIFAEWEKNPCFRNTIMLEVPRSTEKVRRVYEHIVTDKVLKCPDYQKFTASAVENTAQITQRMTEEALVQFVRILKERELSIAWPDLEEGSDLQDNVNKIRDWMKEDEVRRKLCGIWTLDLSGSNLVTLPLEIGYFQGLGLLRLGRTKIKWLPVLQLPKLQILDLRFTKIKWLPKLDLPNLRTLMLSHTPLEQFSISNFPLLRELYLAYTKIKNLPKLDDLSNLEVMNVRSAQLLEQLPALNLPCLRSLDLEGCTKIQQLPDINLPSLEEVYIAGTKIDNLSLLGGGPLFFESDSP